MKADRVVVAGNGTPGPEFCDVCGVRFEVDDEFYQSKTSGACCSKECARAGHLVWCIGNMLDNIARAVQP